MPVTAPDLKARSRPCPRLFWAATAVRTLARTDTFMPMKPVAPDSTAPIRNPPAAHHGCWPVLASASTGWPRHQGLRRDAEMRPLAVFTVFYHPAGVLNGRVLIPRAMLDLRSSEKPPKTAVYGWKTVAQGF